MTGSQFWGSTGSRIQPGALQPPWKNLGNGKGHQGGLPLSSASVQLAWLVGL